MGTTTCRISKDSLASRKDILINGGAALRANSNDWSYPGKTGGISKQSLASRRDILMVVWLLGPIPMTGHIPDSESYGRWLRIDVDSFELGRFLMGSLPIAMVLMTRLSENFCRSSSIMAPRTHNHPSLKS
ncbi:hypothetical protein AVEN_82751-1 [Araneus ventricosus]|uniref:Uncharacterized protein n=1 Tax=Araneus ventricosus TaxID=182803 RepID=A0A4Y2ECR8_ARAVE|nr:hypothetical protein AVEN_82751-1 [Araneus ventricosus]